jgi:hypothetical protein
MEKFRKAFRRVADPRADNARHDLLEVLFIALAATLCGAESCSDMADFGQSKEDLLRFFLRLEHGIPSHDTFSRVFRLLKPQAFELAFRRFMAAFAKANRLKLTGVVAVDGKALRGAYDRVERPTRCTWSTSLQWMPAWPWLSKRQLVATRRRALWRCWTFCRWKDASLPPMRCIVPARLRRQCASAAATMF